MSEIKNANITINIIEGNISITGSEEFVEKNMGAVFAFVERTGVNYSPKKNTLAKSENIVEKIESTNIESVPLLASNEALDKYKKHGLYSVDSEDGTISIHRKIPGNNNAEKMKNVALIVLYEKKEAIEGNNLKALCEKQGCWDANNASAIFERDIVNFIKKKKSSKVWTLELTIDGEAAAVALLEEMLNDKK